MRNFFIRMTSALLTFAVGLGLAVVLVRATRPADPPAPPPPVADGQQTLEMVFVLDTTGSMGGLIDGAKQRIWGIVNEVMQTPSKPDVRVGLVAYRDNGDQYVTNILPLTNDLDKVYTTLMDFQAGGGGDWRENVRRALADGVREAGWSRSSKNVAQIIFLVGDAPPHDDYRNEPDTISTTAEAVRRGMIVNTIQCGAADDTRRSWQQIATRGEGQYFAIAQDGGVQVVSTPYDARLSELASRLGSTYLAYGGGGGPDGSRFRAEAAARQDAAERKVAAAAPAAAAADRAANKAINREAYVGDLLQSIENESVKLDEVKTEDLPDTLQKLPPAERQKEIQKRLDERKKIREEIVSLSRQRDAHIAAERRKSAGANQTGFDAAVATALKAQMAKKGIK